MKPGEMVLIIGKTGSGKTVRAQELVKRFRLEYPDVGIVIINPKPVKTDWDLMIKPVGDGKKSIVPKWHKGALINWKVKPWQEYELNDFLWEIYTSAKPCLIVFDEGQEIKNHKYPSAAALWRQGREMKISVLTCTQRPVDMSRYAISQARYIEVFNIIGEDDLKALDSYMEIPLRHYISPSRLKHDGSVIEGKKLKEYQYLHYDVKTGKAVINEPQKPTEHFPFVNRKPLPIKKIGLVGLSVIALLKVFA